MTRPLLFLPKKLLLYLSAFNDMIMSEFALSAEKDQKPLLNDAFNTIGTFPWLAISTSV